MVGGWDNPRDWHRAAQLGVTNYGQMTAGGWMYIGPQGIVHGTYNTILNAGRLFLGLAPDQDLAGQLFVSSGLGGMSGAQPKAAEIAGAVGVIAEVDQSRIQTRLDQGWVKKASPDLPQVFAWAGRRPGTGAPCPSPTTATSWTFSSTAWTKASRSPCCRTRPPATRSTTAATAPRA